MVPIEVQTDTPIILKDGESEDVDFQYARNNYIEIIETSKAAMTTAVRVAAESENPRAIEVLGNLLKVAADINRQMVQMSKDKEDIKTVKANRGKKSGEAPQINSTNTVVFTGTSADLAKLLKES